MRKKKLIILLLISVILFYPIHVFSATVNLKSGKTVQGKIIEKADKYITIDLQGVNIRYYLDEIANIEDEETPDAKSSCSGIEEKSGAEIYKIVSPAVVLINAGASQGSGFVIDKSGIIVTNWHVVSSSPEISITLKDGTVYPCTGVINYNIIKDICILKINPRGEMSSISLGEYGAVEIGDKAYAIGSPLGLQSSISDGIISQKQEGILGKQIQVTCPISSGNSGGPLLNKKCEVSGIMTMSLVPSANAIAQNLNFAESSDEIKGLLDIDKNLSVAKFAELTKEDSVFQQGQYLLVGGKYQEAFVLYDKVFQTSCRQFEIDTSRTHCFNLFIMMLDISAKQTAFWGGKYQQVMMSILKNKLENKPSLSSEQLRDGEAALNQMREWAAALDGLIEKFGGLRNVYEKLASTKRYTDQELSKIKEGLCVGYVNLAIDFTMDPNGESQFDQYSNIVKEAFPDAQSSIKLLSDFVEVGKIFWKK